MNFAQGQFHGNGITNQSILQLILRTLEYYYSPEGFYRVGHGSSFGFRAKKIEIQLFSCQWRAFYVVTELRQKNEIQIFLKQDQDSSEICEE